MAVKQHYVFNLHIVNCHTTVTKATKAILTLNKGSYNYVVFVMMTNKQTDFSDE